MQFKHRISIAVIGLVLCAGSIKVPAFAQQESTSPTPEQSTPNVQPTTENQVESTTENQAEDAKANQELSAPDAEIEQLVNENLLGPDEEVIGKDEADVNMAPNRNDAADVKKAPINRERALRQALTQVGYHETPVNCNKFSSYFNRGCQLWCADFASWAFDSTSDRDKKLPWRNPSAVFSILQWAQRTGAIVKTPQRGDLFIVEKNGKSHVGFVRKVKGNVFYTVEGNSSNQVARNKRPGSEFVFVRVPAL